VATVAVSADYFQTIGASLRLGRNFSSVDSGASLPVAVVNERFAGLWWPGADPIGKRLRIFNGRAAGAWLTVVGVASNIVQTDRTGQEPEAVVYRPLEQTGVSIVWALARTRIPLESLASAVRSAIAATDPDLLVGPPDARVVSLRTRLRDNYWTRAVNGGLLATFGGLALVLASLGLYALVAEATSHQTREIGIRTALGATAWDVRAWVLKQGMLPAALGLGIGLLALLLVMPLLHSQLVAVSPTDPLTVAAATLVLLACALVGCWIPARRASRVDPIVALRTE
jgi:hypothetical protein